jgi:hypothetical protein
LFQFTGDAAGTIPAGGRIVVANLRPGTYSSTESDPRPLYELDSIRCSDADSTGDRASRKATFDLDPGETVVCVFTNKALPCPATASPTSLWPPNHRLIPVTLTGLPGLSLTILRVVQDEPIEGLGDGDMTPDALRSTRPNEVLLRAERSGLHDGRVYRLEYRLQDGLGRTCTSSIPLAVVPHDQGQGETAVDSGPPYFNSFGD